MTQALVRTDNVSRDEWAVMREQADMLIKSQFLPSSVNTPEKAVAIMLKGRELGVPPMAALSGINVIQGKPTVSPQLMLSLINRTHELQRFQIVESTDKVCRVVIQRRGQPAHEETFTIQDAAALGLAGKDNYKRQPKVMLRWRCVAAAARLIFPDVLDGVYLPEELGAEVRVTEEGETYVEVEAAPAPAAPENVVEMKRAGGEVRPPEDEQGGEEPPPSPDEQHAELNETIRRLWEQIGKDPARLDATINTQFKVRGGLGEITLAEKRQVAERLAARLAEKQAESTERAAAR